MATYNFNTCTKEERIAAVNTKAGQKSLVTRSFLYMFLLLLFTGAVSVIIHFCIEAAHLNTRDANNVYVIMLMVSAFAQIFLTVIISFTMMKGGKSSWIPMLLYSACMGVLISSFAFVLNWYTVLSAFIISALAFAGMSLIGYFAKNASAFALVGFGALFAVALAALMNIFFIFFLPVGVWSTMNIVISSIIIVAILSISAYEVWQIKAVAQHGYESSNLALYFAFQLYLDFIVIFIHLLRILAIFANRRN